MTPSKKRMASVAAALGRRIAAMRVERGMTQEELAARLGSNKSVLSRVENGANIPSVERLVAIADVFGVELRALFDGVVAEGIDPREADIAEVAAMLRGRPAAEVRKVLDVVRVMGK